MKQIVVKKYRILGLVTKSKIVDRRQQVDFCLINYSRQLNTFGPCASLHSHALIHADLCRWWKRRAAHAAPLYIYARARLVTFRKAN